MKAAASVWAMMLGAGLLAGCERAKQDMYDQPRYKTFAAGALWDDGATARTAPDGTQPRARGDHADSSGGRLGAAAVARDIAAEQAQSNPYPADLRLLERGRNRYTIYCVPCHSPVGDGDGLVVRRGFPSPPSFHQPRLRDAPDRHLYDVISRGYGVMAPYADRVEPADRWAIVAFIRALQLSQYVPAERLPARERARLDAGEGAGVRNGEAAAGAASPYAATERLPASRGARPDAQEGVDAGRAAAPAAPLPARGAP